MKISKKDKKNLDTLVTLLASALRQVELMKRGGSVPPPYTSSTASSTYNITYDPTQHFDLEDVDVPEEPGIEFVSIGDQVQQAKEKLESAVFPLPEGTDNVTAWAEEGAAYVARFYGQPVDRVHVELFMRPLAEMRDRAKQEAMRNVAIRVRNLHFEGVDNLEIAVGIRDQIANIIAGGAV